MPGLMVVILSIVGVVASASPARAHASLDSSTPAAFAVVDEPPSEVRLRFSEVPQPGFTSIRLVDAAARDLPVGAISAAPDDPRTVVAAVGSPDGRPLERGWYAVVWSVVSGDGHRVSGSFAFSVATPGTDIARDLLDRVNAGGTADPFLDQLIMIVRIWGFVALAMVIGGGWVRHGTGAGRHAPARLGAMVWVGWGWAVAATVTLFPLLAAQLTGGRITDVVDLQRWSGLIAVRQGLALVARLALLGAAAWLIVRPPQGRQRRSWHPTAVAVGFGLALSHSIAGHGATARWSSVAVIVAALHLAAVSGWLGSVASLTVGGRRWQGGPDEALTVVAPLARSAAPLAVVSGIASTLLIGPAPSELLDTRWGRLLIAKVLVVSVLVVIGALLGRAASSAGPRRSRLLVAELVMGAVALTLAGALVSTPPVAATVVDPVTVTQVQGGVLIEITITPARVGSNELHLIMSPPGGALQPVRQVTAQLEALDRDLPPFALDVAVAGVNHWTAPVQFPYGGRWELVIAAEVRPLEVVQYRTAFDISQ